MTGTPPEPPVRAETPPAEPEPSSRGIGGVLAWLLAVGLVGLVLVVALGATPFWAPAVMHLLPWGGAVPTAKPTASAPPPAAAAPDPAIAAMLAQAAQNAAAVQQLGQRIAALEAKPAPAPPDLSAIQQQLATLTKTTAELGAGVAALQKAEQDKPALDPNNAALALVLLQIREAVEMARPFGPEYQALLLLARDRSEIAAAAQPLAAAAASGVASRTALSERLRQLAPRIATAAPSPEAGWKSRIVARLRALVTIRRIEGGSQTPAEAAVNTAERDMASGNLAGAVDALAGLTGPSRTAAEPWLQMARQRLAVETALHQVAAAVTAVLGSPALNTPAPGKG